MNAAPRDDGPRFVPITDLTPADALALGLTPIPLRASGERKAPRPDGWERGSFDPAEWHPGESVGLRCGLQRDGSYLVVLDYDHRPELGIDAPALFESALARIPEQLRARLFTALSTGRRGRYIAFRTMTPCRGGWLRGAQRQKIGDVLGTGRQVVAPTRDRWLQGTLATIPLLTADETAIISGIIGYTPGESPATLIDIDAPKVERWLANIDQLLGADKLPRRLKNPEGQTRRVLDGRFTFGNGSDDRACVCRGLVLHGYPDAEIAALLIHFCDYGASRRKGSRWLYQDITRLIAKERAQQTHVTPSLSLLVTPRQPTPLPEVEPQRKGRPRTIDADGYLVWLTANVDAGSVVLKTRRELAVELGISVPTVDRLEATLRARGEIERQTSKDRRRSWLTVLGTIKSPAHPAQIAAAAASEVLSEPDRAIGTRACEKKHTAPEGLPAAAEAWEQLPAVDLPKRARRTRPVLDSLPPLARLAELQDRLRAVRRCKRKAKWLQHDSQVRALEWAGEKLRLQIEALTAELAASTPPPAGVQIALDAAPSVALSGAVCSSPLGTYVPQVLDAAPRQRVYPAAALAHIEAERKKAAAATVAP